MRGGPGETQIETRPPHDRRARQDAARSGSRRCKRQRSTQRRARERTRRLPRLARRLHQRRQVDAVQRAVKAPRPTPPTSCSPRSTRRRAALPAARRGARSSLSDTVGFIRDLPHELVAAFRRRSQEAADADLLLHVVDAANPQRDEQIDEVQRVLHEIGAADVPQSWSSTRSTASRRPSGRACCATCSSCDGGVRVPRVFVSALTGEGLDRAARAHRRIRCTGRSIERVRRRPHLRMRSDAQRSPVDDGDDAADRHRSFARMNPRLHRLCRSLPMTCLTGRRSRRALA